MISAFFSGFIIVGLLILGFLGICAYAGYMSAEKEQERSSRPPAAPPKK